MVMLFISDVDIGDEVIPGKSFANIGPWSYGVHLHFGIYCGPSMPPSNWGRMPCSNWPDTNGFVDPIQWIENQIPKSYPVSTIIAWARKADMPAVMGGTPVAVNGKIYVFGGWDSDLVYEYDPLSNAWTQKASMPQARGGTVALYYDGKIYIAGGNPTPNGSLRLDVYDPETDSWQSEAPMPHDLWGGWGVAGGTVGDKLYVIGGYNWPKHEEDYCREYDIATNSWSLKTPMPTAVEWMNAAVYNDKIYVVAGQYGTGTHTLLDYIQVYDPSDDSWDIISGLSIYLQGSGVIAYNNKLYIFGGNAGSPPFPILSSQKERNLTVYSYDFNSGVFTKEGDMPVEDHGQVCLIDNKIYLIGAGENRNETWEGLFFVHGEEIIHQEQITIQQDETIQRTFNIFDYVTEIIVSRIIQGSDVEMSLIQPPDGTLIDRNTIDPNVHHVLGATYEVYRISNPMSGEWTVRLFGADIPGEHELTNLTVSVNTVPNQPPIADAGQDQTVAVGINCIANVILDGSGSSDPDEDTLTYSWTWDSGSATGMNQEIQLPLGVHAIMLTVNDGIVDSNSDTVDITVVDNASPEISVTVTPDELWPPNHKMVLITPEITVIDNCDPDPVVGLISITMNEEEKAKGKGHTVDDIYIDENGNIYLRAERSGTGDGRIYIITYSATDASSNSSFASATVVVSHNR